MDNDIFYYREAFEEETEKLLEIIGKREETICALEEKCRSALEISIRADIGNL